MTIESTYYDNKQLKYRGVTDDDFIKVEDTTWYENGQKHSNVTYTKSGNLLDLLSWYENGQLKYEVIDDLMDKTFKSWYENGQLKFSKVLIFDFSLVMILTSEEWFDEDGNSIKPLVKHRSKPSHEEELELMEFMEGFFKPEDDRILGSDFLYLHL